MHQHHLGDLFKYQLLHLFPRFKSSSKVKVGLDLNIPKNSHLRLMHSFKDLLKITSHFMFYCELKHSSSFFQVCYDITRWPFSPCYNGNPLFMRPVFLYPLAKGIKTCNEFLLYFPKYTNRTYLIFRQASQLYSYIPLVSKAFLCSLL